MSTGRKGALSLMKEKKPYTHLHRSFLVLYSLCFICFKDGEEREKMHHPKTEMKRKKTKNPHTHMHTNIQIHTRFIQSFTVAQRAIRTVPWGTYS